MTKKRYFVCGCAHVFSKTVRNTIHAHGFTFHHSQDAELVWELTKSKRPEVLVVDMQTMTQLVKSSDWELPPSTMVTILSAPTQLLQVHPWLESGYVHDYLTSVNKGQICCLLDKVERFHNQLEARNQNETPDESRSIENLFEKRFQPVLRDLEVASTTGLYDMVLKRIERPLIQMVLKKTGGNQLMTAKILGLNRNTLRKRLRELDLLDDEKTRPELRLLRSTSV